MASDHDQQPVPREPTRTGTSMVETATSAIQSFAPIKKIHQHLCAFHYYAYDMTRQVEAHHFCSHQNEEMRQCLIYDSPDSTARLIGVEYIISDRLFLTLPDSEKPFWHSHEYEVKSGILFLPGVPAIAQRPDMQKLTSTYGKTIHFWQVDRGDALPIGEPQLMMALTDDGQLREDLGKDVERRFRWDFDEERGQREYMSGPEHGIHQLANGARKGWKFVIREVDVPPAE